VPLDVSAPPITSVEPSVVAPETDSVPLSEMLLGVIAPSEIVSVGTLADVVTPASTPLLGVTTKPVTVPLLLADESVIVFPNRVIVKLVPAARDTVLAGVTAIAPPPA
jgi:hypothetical protein